MLSKTLKHQLKSHFGTATKHLPTSAKREIKSIQYFKDYEACSTAERQPKKAKVSHSDLSDDMIVDDYATAALIDFYGPLDSNSDEAEGAYTAYLQERKRGATSWYTALGLSSDSDDDSDDDSDEENTPTPAATAPICVPIPDQKREAAEDFVVGYEWIGNNRIEILIEDEVFRDNIHVKVED